MESTIKKLVIFRNVVIALAIGFFILCIFWVTILYIQDTKEVVEKAIETVTTPTNPEKVIEELPGSKIINAQQNKLLKLVYKFCDKENIFCYVYTKAGNTGKLVFLGKCIGYDAATILKANPRALNAMMLMMVDPKTNKPGLVYIGVEVIISPFKFQ